MAIIIPLITQYDGKGIARAKKEFAQLEGFGAKAGFILRKSMLPVGAALGAIGAAAFQAGDALLGMANAAAEDQAEQKQLARTLQNTTKATDAQVAAVEDYIDKTQKAYGFTDSKLRPAFARLVRSTKDVGEAQKLLNISMDIAASTGKDLQAVANAVGRAHDGQFTALGRLGLGLDAATLKSKDFDKVIAEIEKRTAGSAAAAADTFQGKMNRLRIRFDELQETIGEKLLPYLELFIDAASRVLAAVDAKGLAGGLQQLRYEFGQLAMSENFSWLKGLYDKIRLVNQAVVIATGNMYDFWNLTVGNAAKLFGKDLKISKPGVIPTWEQMFQNVAPVVTGPLTGSPTSTDLIGGRITGSSIGGVTRPNINVTVTSADPRAVVDALVKYNRQNGAIPVTVGR